MIFRNKSGKQRILLGIAFEDKGSGDLSEKDQKSSLPSSVKKVCDDATDDWKVNSKKLSELNLPKISLGKSKQLLDSTYFQFRFQGKNKFGTNYVANTSFYLYI